MSTKDRQDTLGPLLCLLLAIVALAVMFGA
jgi:hypothetical protein